MKKIFVLILCLVALTSCSFSSENPTASTSENSDDVLIMATNAYFHRMNIMTEIKLLESMLISQKLSQKN